MELSEFSHYLGNHFFLTALLVWFCAFIESLAIIGSIVPGSITMGAIGTLIGDNTLNFWSTWTLATLGALMGDYLSYWIGLVYSEKIAQWRIFSRHPEWLQKGHQFFEKYGAKSVFVGRFIGPVRSMIPMIAGMMKMQRRPLIYAIIPSALLWSLLYLSPGIIFGGLTKDMSPELATRYLIIGFAALTGLWILCWTLKRLYASTHQVLNRACKHYWHRPNAHPCFSTLRECLSTLDPEDSHHQLVLILKVLLAGGLFFYLITLIQDHNSFIYQINMSVYQFFQTLPIRAGDTIAIFISFLGQTGFLALTIAPIVLWALLEKEYQLAIHWIILLGLTVGLVSAIKTHLGIIRPGHLPPEIYDFSFPSGHTAGAMAVYTFLGATLAQTVSREHRWIPRLCGLGLALLVGFSRPYLQFHWSSDVLGGILLGSAISALTFLSLRATQRRFPAFKRYLWVSLLSLGLAMSVYFPTHFEDLKTLVAQIEVNNSTQTESPLL